MKLLMKPLFAALLLAAGTNFEQDGLLGSIAASPAAVPEAFTTLSLGLLLAFGGLALAVRRRKPAC